MFGENKVMGSNTRVSTGPQPTQVLQPRLETAKEDAIALGSQHQMFASKRTTAFDDMAQAPTNFRNPRYEQVIAGPSNKRRFQRVPSRRYEQMITSMPNCAAFQGNDEVTISHTGQQASLANEKKAPAEDTDSEASDGTAVVGVAYEQTITIEAQMALFLEGFQQKQSTLMRQGDLQTGGQPSAAPYGDEMSAMKQKTEFRISLPTPPVEQTISLPSQQYYFGNESKAPTKDARSQASNDTAVSGHAYEEVITMQTQREREQQIRQQEQFDLMRQEHHREGAQPPATKQKTGFQGMRPMAPVDQSISPPSQDLYVGNSKKVTSEFVISRMPKNTPPYPPFRSRYEQIITQNYQFALMRIEQENKRKLEQVSQAPDEDVRSQTPNGTAVASPTPEQAILQYHKLAQIMEDILNERSLPQVPQAPYEDGISTVEHQPTSFAAQQASLPGAKATPIGNTVSADMSEVGFEGHPPTRNTPNLKRWPSLYGEMLSINPNWKHFKKGRDAYEESIASTSQFQTLQGQERHNRKSNRKGRIENAYEESISSISQCQTFEGQKTHVQSEGTPEVGERKQVIHQHQENAWLAKSGGNPFWAIIMERQESAPSETSKSLPLENEPSKKRPRYEEMIGLRREDDPFRDRGTDEVDIRDPYIEPLQKPLKPGPDDDMHSDIHQIMDDHNEIYPFLGGYASGTNYGPTVRDLYQQGLSNDSIRLLEVLAGAANEPLFCRLHVATLRQARFKYEALSYCWEREGEGVPQTKPMTCNGKVVHIGENLFQAIRRIRNTRGSRIIWADALCINQMDPKEQTQQVRKMNSIFKLAARVIIWLGEGNARDACHPDVATWGNPSLAFLGICNVVNDWRRNNRFGSKIPVATFSSLTDDPHQSACENRSGDRTQKDMLSLFQCRWFQRVWVIQEAALARRAKVLWGLCEIPWDCIGLAAAITRTQFEGLQESDMVRSDQQRRIVPTGVVNGYLMYRISQSQTVFDPLKFSFYRLLVLTRQFQCKNRLDKIFGILGIPTTDQSTEGGKPFVQPDYSKSIQEIYHEIANKIIDTSSSLALLSSVQGARDGEVLYADLPSWVPQWHYILTRTLTPMEPDGNFQPGAGRPFQRRRHPDSRKLIVRGIDAEAVSGIGEQKAFVMDHDPSLNHSEDPEVSSDSYTCTSQTSADVTAGLTTGSSKKRITCPHERIEALALTLTAGKDWYGLPVRDIHSHSADFANCLLLNGLKWTLEGSAFGQHNDNTVITPTIDLAELSSLRSTTPTRDASRFLDTAVAVVKDRKLFSTASGMRGVGPREMLPGDRVCVLYGANMPFVLRRQGDGYVVVGECYVYDLMHGEAVSKLQHGLRERWIELV